MARPVRRLPLALAVALLLAAALPALARADTVALDGDWSLAYTGSTPSPVPAEYADPDTSGGGHSAPVILTFAHDDQTPGNGTTNVKTFPFPYTTDGSADHPWGRALLLSPTRLLIVVRSPTVHATPATTDFVVLDGTATDGGWAGRYAACGPAASHVNTIAGHDFELAHGTGYEEGNFTLLSGSAPARPAGSLEEYGHWGTHPDAESPLCATARGYPSLLSGGVAGAPASTGTRPTGIAVQCNRGPAPGDPFTCTATVGDAEPASPLASAPTGQVTFTSDSGGFGGAPTCTLVHGQGTTSYCTVTYVNPSIPAGTQVPVTALYLGSAVHAPSSGHHTLVYSTPPGDDQPPTTTTVTTTQPPPTTATTDPEPHPTLDQCAAQTPTRAAVRTSFDARPGEGIVDAATRNTAWCFFQIGNVLENGVPAAAEYAVGGLWVGVPAVAAGTLGSELGVPGALAGGIVGGGAMYQYVGGSAIFARANANADAVAHEWNDPPDPRYRTLAKVARAPRFAFRGGRGVSRAAARRFNAWAKASARSRATAAALAVTVDRAGGAAKARDDAWTGRQTRWAITLSRRLAGQVLALQPLRAAVARDARRNAAARRKVSLAALRAARTRIARHGFTARQRRALRRAGLTATDLARAQALARTTKRLTAIPRSAAALFGSAALRTQDRREAAFLRLWPELPDVAARAKLR